MKRRAKVQYTDEPIEVGEPVFDFLPSPEALAKAPRRVKVTITLSYESLTWFKEQGERLKTPYQRMIRNLVDEYVRQMKARPDEEPTPPPQQ